MNDDPGTLFQSRNEHLQNLDAVLVRPIMEDGAEVVHVCLDRLWREEVAASKVKMGPSCAPETYCAAKFTLPFKLSGSLDAPSFTVSGRSWTVH